MGGVGPPLPPYQGGALPLDDIRMLLESAHHFETPAAICSLCSSVSSLPERLELTARACFNLYSGLRNRAVVLILDSLADFIS